MTRPGCSLDLLSCLPLYNFVMIFPGFDLFLYSIILVTITFNLQLLHQTNINSQRLSIANLSSYPLNVMV